MIRTTRRGFLAAAATVAAESQTADWWRAGERGYPLFRIPGLVVTRRGTLIAYCEARRTTRGDWGAIDIELRRAGAPVIAMPRPTAAISKNPVALAQDLAPADQITFNNPVAIASRRGEIHFVFCAEYMRAFYTRSRDDGRTWSAPVEITPAFDEFRPEYAWKVLATGPGHGIELRSGRLLIPVWLSLGTGGHAHRPSVASTIYSDDRGASWHRGEIAIPNAGEWVNPSETVAVELADGSVMLNARSESAAHRRLVSVSRNGATGWSRPRFQQELLEPVCFGAMVRAGRRIAFANPDTLAGRKNLTVQFSHDEGESWRDKHVIDAGPSAYCDLAWHRGKLYCLYERPGALTLSTSHSE